MDGIDNYVMQDATTLVLKHMHRFYEIHTVTVVMNDMSPEITLQGYVKEHLAEHLTITFWKGETKEEWS